MRASFVINNTFAQPKKRFLWWLGFVPQPNLQNDFDGGWVSCLNPTYKTILMVVGFRASTQPTKRFLRLLGFAIAQPNLQKMASSLFHLLY